MSTRQTIDEIKKILKENEECIARDFKAELIGIFGSYVHGEQKEGSDIDVLVKFYKGATLFEFVGLALFLEDKFGIKVDVIPYDTVREEIKERIFEEAVYL